MSKRSMITAALALAAVATVFSADPALAQDFLEDATDKINEVYRTTLSVVYTVGGFGIIVLGILAFFGRFKWSHLLALAGGLFLIGATDALITYLSDDPDFTGAGDSAPS